MESVEVLLSRLKATLPHAEVSLGPSTGTSGLTLLVSAASAPAVAAWLKNDADCRFDFCSNVTGIDYLPKEVTETVKVTLPAEGETPAKVVEQKTKRLVPGYLEVVYHLYSIEKRQGPLLLRQRTADRSAHATVASLTPVWRACEFQEREAFDLFGITFTGHPDLRRILLWDEFQDHPMRKDYVEPDDYEWEPTPHDEALTRAKGHYPSPSA